MIQSEKIFLLWGVRTILSIGHVLAVFHFLKNSKNFLNSIDAFTYDENVKYYMNHKNFCIDIKNVNLANIDNIQDAFAILMGLEAEYLQRYLDLNEVIINSDENLDEQILLNDDDRWFHSEYESFTRSYFYDGDIDIIVLYQQSTTEDLWTGHLHEYVSKLYNSGIVLRCDIQEALQDFGIFLQYDKDSWVYRMYHAWQEKRAWTFKEALYLFKGCALDTPRKIVDLRQNSWLLNLETQSVWNAVSRQQLCLKDLLRRHVAIFPELEEFRYQEHTYYRPEQIILWLCENTNLLPPPILVDIIYSVPQKEKFYDTIEQSINKLAIIHENLNEEKQQYTALNEPEKCRQLIQDILPFWESYTSSYKEEPSMQDVMDYLISHNPSLLAYKNRSNSSLLHAVKKGAIISAFEKYTEEKAKRAS